MTEAERSLVESEKMVEQAQRHALALQKEVERLRLTQAEALDRARRDQQRREQVERDADRRIVAAEKSADERASKAEAAFRLAADAATERGRTAEEASEAALARADEHLVEIDRLGEALSVAETALAEALSRSEATEASVDDRAENLRGEMQAAISQKARDAEAELESALSKAYGELGHKVEAAIGAERERGSLDVAKVEQALELSERSRQEAMEGMEFWQARAVQAEKLLEAIEKQEAVVELLAGADVKGGKHRALGSGPGLREFLVQGSRGILASDVDISSHPIRSGWKHQASEDEIYQPPGLPDQN